MVKLSDGIVPNSTRRKLLVCVLAVLESVGHHSTVLEWLFWENRQIIAISFLDTFFPGRSCIYLLLPCMQSRKLLFEINSASLRC